MQPEFFGSNQELFGIYHPPRGNPAPPVRGVVICPPFGQEYIRSHWCLRLLAAQLARKGIHVLRFDYFGIGDSKGNPQEVFSLDRWEHNVDSAVDRLISISGSTSCQLLGLRTGASLASRVAVRRSDVNSLVLWEPVESGRRWLDSTRKLHTEMLDLWVCKMETVRDGEHEELLGSVYSQKLLDRLGAPLIDWSSLELPSLVVDTIENKCLYENHNNSMQKVIFTEDENSWDDLRQLETAWLRPQTTRLIVDQIQDVFERLIRFNVLAAPLETIS